ncbi:MAG: PspA/IM30 family protein [Synechococcales bacterium]|nr:PspA/IM30 family protein [Synechococcales bacterium]
MSLFDRLSRLTRAKLTDLTQKKQDPEQVLEQVVAELQKDLVDVRQAVAKAIATQKRTERQTHQAQNLAEEYYRRAQLALQKGDDSLARDALARRRSYQETAEAMTVQIQQQTQVVQQLRDNLRKLEAKVIEIKTKKDLYIVRARSAQSTQLLNELLNQTGTGKVMQVFDRMEEKVLQLEALAELSAEMNVDQLEEQFKKLGEADELDAELAALKSNLSASGQLPSPQSASDPELEKLRREIRGS